MFTLDAYLHISLYYQELHLVKLSNPHTEHYAQNHEPQGRILPHPSLRQITCNLTYHDIHELRRETLASLSSVPTILGGDTNGHGVSATKYALLSDVQYVHPTHPGTYTTKTDPTKEAAASRIYIHQLNAYIEANHVVTKAIINQL